MVLLRLIGAATKLLTTYTRPPRALRDNKDTPNKKYILRDLRIGQDLKGRDNKDTSNKEIEFIMVPNIQKQVMLLVESV